MAYEGKHRGQPKAGYSRGSREKPGSRGFMPPTPPSPSQSVQLGVMTAGNMMAFHEHNRQREYNVSSAKKNMAKAQHPSAGNRSAEFMGQAENYGKAAGASYANMKAAGSTTERVGPMQGRQVHFDLGRKAGFSGLN